MKKYSTENYKRTFGIMTIETGKQEIRLAKLLFLTFKVEYVLCDSTGNFVKVLTEDELTWEHYAMLAGYIATGYNKVLRFYLQDKKM